MNQLQLTDKNIVEVLAPGLLTSPKDANGYSTHSFVYHKEIRVIGSEPTLVIGVARLKYINKSQANQAADAAKAALGVAVDSGKQFIILRSSLKLPASVNESPLLNATIGQVLTIANTPYEMVEVCNTLGIGSPVRTVNSQGEELQRTTMVNDQPTRVYQELPIVAMGTKAHSLLPYNGPSLPLLGEAKIGAAATPVAEAAPINPDAV